MKDALLFATYSIMLALICLYIGGARVSGNEIDRIDAELGEARYLKTVATGRTRTLEKDLGACEGESVHITVVTTSGDTEGIYLKATGKGGD